MSTHTVTEARERLSDLIDRALRGEDVIILRDGQPAIQLRAFDAADDGAGALFDRVGNAEARRAADQSYPFTSPFSRLIR
jgi:antitoxin (DNA-binding transcriptional repressor) of toxin-antitoxin stability system